MVGRIAVATLKFKNACNAMVKVAPAPSSMPKRSGARQETIRPRMVNRRKKTTTSPAPMKPSSSPTTEKTKSEWGSGR